MPMTCTLVSCCTTPFTNALNEQIVLEGQSSPTPTSRWPVWAETQGFDGVAEFLYTHSEEERQHMLKLMRFVNERGGVAQVPTVGQGHEYSGLKEILRSILNHETKVTECINNNGGFVLAGEGLHHPQLHAVVRERAD